MPMRFLAHLRLLLDQAGPPAVPHSEPAQRSVPSVPQVAPPASLTWASLEGSPSSSQPGPTNAEKRAASGAGASTSGAQEATDRVRKRWRRRSEAPPEAAPTLPESAQVAAAAAAPPPELLEDRNSSGSVSSLSSSSVGVGKSDGDEEAVRLAAAVADIQNRRCPPLGRFGHGSSSALKVTARARTLPFAVKVRLFMGIQIQDSSQGNAQNCSCRERLHTCVLHACLSKHTASD